MRRQSVTTGTATEPFSRGPLAAQVTAGTAAIAATAVTAGESASLVRENCVASLPFFLISHRHITVILGASSAPPTVRAMPLPDPEACSVCDPEAVRLGRPGADRLISIGDIPEFRRCESGLVPGSGG